MSTDVLMRRIIAVITCLAAIAGVLCGCNIFDNRTYHWEFEQEYSAAKEILIVDVSCDDGIYREELLKSLSLESAKDIFRDIEAIDFKKYGPNQLTTHGRCIKIVFENVHRKTPAPNPPDCGPLFRVIPVYFSVLFGWWPR